MLVDHDARTGERVEQGIGPQLWVVQRVAAQQMSVEAVEVHETCAGVARKAQSRPAPGTGSALHERAGVCADVARDELRVTLVTAVGEHDGGCADRAFPTIGHHVDTTHAVALEDEAGRGVPEMQRDSERSSPRCVMAWSSKSGPCPRSPT